MFFLHSYTYKNNLSHYHPGDTTSTVLWGRGQFYSNSTGPLQQPLGSVYFIPEGMLGLGGVRWGWVGLGGGWEVLGGG